MQKKASNLVPNRLKPLVKKAYYKVSSKLANSKSQCDSLKGVKYFISENRYGSYCVPASSSHRIAARKILANEVYEPKTIEFMMSNCGDGDIVHAGTYFGDFLPALSKSCGEKSKVWAFEPNPENYRCAKITIQINDISNVVLSNAGLGARKGSVRMRTTDSAGRSLGGSSYIDDKNRNDIPGLVSVEIVTVDEMLGKDRPVSIIQLDVEGFEKEALSGALKTIGRYYPIIILETRPNSTLFESDWFSDNVLKLGYKMKKHIHGNKVFVFEPDKRDT